MSNLEPCWQCQCGLAWCSKARVPGSSGKIGKDMRTTLRSCLPPKSMAAAIVLVSDCSLRMAGICVGHVNTGACMLLVLTSCPELSKTGSALRVEHQLPACIPC